MKPIKYNVGLLILRVCVGGLMLFHGYSKVVNGIDGIINLFNDIGIPGVLAYAVYIGEVVAPVLLLVGYKSKLGALGIVITMLVALFTAHINDFLKLGSHGEWALEVLAFYLLGGIVILLLGGGKFSLSTKSQWD